MCPRNSRALRLSLMIAIMRDVCEWMNLSADSRWGGWCGVKWWLVLLNYWWPAFWLKCRVNVKVKAMNLMFCCMLNNENQCQLAIYTCEWRGRVLFARVVLKVKTIHGPLPVIPTIQLLQLLLYLLANNNEPNIWFISKWLSILMECSSSFISFYLRIVYSVCWSHSQIL